MKKLLFTLPLVAALSACATQPVYVHSPCKEEVPPPAEKPLQAMRGQVGQDVDKVLQAAIVESENLLAREVLLEAALAHCRK